MTVWPASLPQYPMGPTGDALQDPRARSQIEQGAPHVRTRTTAAPRHVDAPMVLTGTQLATFDAFYETDLAFGALRFQWTDFRDDAPAQYRFLEPPKWSSLRGGAPADRLWQATLKLERLPGAAV
jgi:hypothetical protein